MKNEEIIKQMTLEEKASLLSGADVWHTQKIERLNIPSIMLTDGPHGLRKQTEESVGVHDSVKATCFPTAVTTASSWDEDLLTKMGKTLGEEALQEKVGVVLGPGCNIKRSPLCGRNFEYFSEDPYLAGKLAAGFINGVQSQGIATSLKHFAANNQEKRRMSISSCMDERTFREIYLTQFEIAVKQANPKTLMCSYNRINDVYSSENNYLLNDILRKEWGYDGLVMSDWGACNDRPLGVQNGLDLEMPSSAGYNTERIVEAVNSKKLDESFVDIAVDNLLELVKYAKENEKDNYKYDEEEHNDIANEIAKESAVLLKNNNVLPLSDKEKVLVLGALAECPRYQGAGSSHICPHKVTSLLDGLEELGIDYDYRPAYQLDRNKKSDKLLLDAVNAAQNYDKIILAIGLTDDYEAEGFDRTNMDLPKSHINLINAISQLKDKKIVCNIQCGSPIVMPWIDKVDAILLSYLGGQSTGKAAAEILFGLANPCGKLAETFPLKMEDVPSYRYFPGDGKSVQYREGVYVGYRYYTTANVPVLFPFGYGLSYTEFKYNSIEVDKKDKKYSINDTVKVNVNIENIGKVDGKEIVEVYISPKKPNIDRPIKELKAFKKVYLESSNNIDIEFTLDKRSFAYYDVDKKDFVVDKGLYDIIVAKNVNDMSLVETIEIIDGEDKDKHLSKDSWYNSPSTKEISDEDFKELLKAELPTPYVAPLKGEFIPDHCFADLVENSFLARRMASIVHFVLKSGMHVKNNDPGLAMMYECFLNSPIRSIPATSQGILSNAGIDGMMVIFNGHFFKGLNMIFKDLSKQSKKRKQSGTKPHF